MTTIDSEPLDERGRQVRLVPLTTGLWMVLLGCGAMVLGPLFGFLVGTMLGSDWQTLGMNSIFFFLFLGFMVAGLGLGAALLGARQMLQNRNRNQEATDTPPSRA